MIVGGICYLGGQWSMAVVTSAAGSVLFWYHFGFLVNLLPNYFDFIEQFKTFGEHDTVKLIFLALVGTTLVSGVVFQRKRISPDKNTKREQDSKFENLI